MQQLDEQRKLDCDRLALAVASVASVASVAIGCEMLRNVAKCCKKLKSRAARAGVH